MFIFQCYLMIKLLKKKVIKFLLGYILKIITNFGIYIYKSVWYIRIEGIVE